MREIKFRAWWRDTMKPIPAFNEEYTIDTCNVDLFIVNQYTGLKDKNGKEIYEGDIVKETLEEDEIWADEDNEPIQLTRQVVWNEHEAAWSIAIDNASWSLNSDDSKAFVEVIGDIYTTPELLSNE